MKNKVTRVLSVLTLVGLVVAAGKYLEPEALERAWDEFSWHYIALLLALPVAYLYFKAKRFSLLLSTTHDSSKRAVEVGYAASQAASLLPGGVAFRSATMTELGVPVEKSMGPVLLNSAMDQFVLLVAGIIAAYWYPQLRFSALVLTATLIVLIAVLSFETSRGMVKSGLLGCAAKWNGEERMSTFFESVGELAGTHTFLPGLGWSVAANAVSLFTLGLVVHALELPVHPLPLLAAFVVPNLLGRLSPLPAGAGVTEAGMVAFMAHQAGLNVNEAAVATALFRLVDVVLPAFYGFLCYHLWWSRATDWKVEPKTGEMREQAA